MPLMLKEKFRVSNFIPMNNMISEGIKSISPFDFD